MPVAVMRRVERPAEQPDPQPVPMAETGNPVNGQGRTCPVPVTM